MEYTFHLQKLQKNKLQVEPAKRFFDSVASGITRKKKRFYFGASLPNNWDETLHQHTKVNTSKGERYRYVVPITIKSTRSMDETTADSFRQSLLSSLLPKLKNREWNLVENNDIVETPLENIQGGVLEGGKETKRPEWILPELTEEVIEKYFNGIYERQPHIRLTHDSTVSFIDSNGYRRGHTILYGKPASAKSSLFTAFKAWYEADITDEKGNLTELERVKFLDFHMTSKAGFENLIIQMHKDGTLPYIFVLEEIEKVPNMEILNVLLTLMASGRLRKTNARIGCNDISTPFLIWATCNDTKLLKKFREGAIWSRFVHRHFCPRPSKELMREILLREVRAIDGEEIWVDKAMELAYVLMPAALKDPTKVMDDPREIIALLDGRERLEDGSYQRDILEIKRREAEEGSTEIEKTVNNLPLMEKLPLVESIEDLNLV